MKLLEEDETVEIVKDGRGKKGGRTWQLTESARVKAKAEKEAKLCGEHLPKLVAMILVRVAAGENTRLLRFEPEWS